MLVNTGDIFLMGEKHRIACGDARNPVLVKSLIGNERINLVLCDVPYGTGMVEGKAGFVRIRKNKIIANDQLQSEEMYRKFTSDWIRAIKPFLAKKNSFYIFNSDKMLFALRNGMQDADVKFTQLLIWIKNHAVMGRLDYLPQHELIAFGWHGAHKFYKSQDKSLIFYPRPNKSPLHPTQKPIGLLQRLILNSSRVGDIVYDGFSGSGSVMSACERTGRTAYMIDVDPEYCKTTIERFIRLTGKKVIKIK